MNATIYQNIIRKKPYLAWWVKDPKNLSEPLLVEIILNYGDFPDVLKLFSTLGIKRVAEIFFEQISRERNNYKPETINFFKLYFARHV